jgi:hypothetical protein
MGKIKILYKIFIGHYEGRFRCRWENSIPIDTWETELRFWNGSIWPWIYISGLLLWTSKWTLQKVRYFLIKKVTTSYFLWGATKNSCIGCLIVEVSWLHTVRHISPVELPCANDQLSQRPKPTQHTANTLDEHPCPQRDSNPQTQQSSSRRSTPHTSRQQGSKWIVISVITDPVWLTGLDEGRRSLNVGNCYKLPPSATVKDIKWLAVGWMMGLARIAAKSIGFLCSTTLRPNLGPNTTPFRYFSQAVCGKREERTSPIYPVLELGTQCCSNPLFHKPQYSIKLKICSNVYTCKSLYCGLNKF